MSLSVSPPSLCSARSLKRHAAVTRDMTIIKEHLDKLDRANNELHHKLDVILSAVNVNDTFASQVNAVESRITGMELLILKTSMYMSMVVC